MTLLLTAQELAPFLDIRQAVDVVEDALREHAAGTGIEFPTYGGSKRGYLRVVGGGLFGAGKMGVRVGLTGALTLLFDSVSWEPLAVLGAPFSHLKVGASMGVAARHLSRSDASEIGMLGSGKNGLAILAALCVVRPIKHVRVYSPTEAHRCAFADRAAQTLAIPVQAEDSAQAALTGADIVVVATNSISPVLYSEDVSPGVHITSMGLETELDESVYLLADQIVATTRDQELLNIDRTNQPRGRPASPLRALLSECRVNLDDVVDLSSIVAGKVAPRTGSADVNIFRESRGGIPDIALANYAYERAREAGLGLEFDFGREARPEWRPRRTPRPGTTHQNPTSSTKTEVAR